MAHSELTKPGLADAKARGVKLGGSRPECRNLTPEARKKGMRKGVEANSRRATTAYEGIADRMLEMRRSGLTLKEIADRLNETGYKTRTGKPWYHVQVKNVLERSFGKSRKGERSEP